VLTLQPGIVIRRLDSVENLNPLICVPVGRSDRGYLGARDDGDQGELLNLGFNKYHWLNDFTALVFRGCNTCSFRLFEKCFLLFLLRFIYNL
jgi:hypothetical protein